MSAEVIGKAFVELNAFLEKKQYRLAAKKADEILKTDKGEIDALRCKLFALAKRSKFEDVVSASYGVADPEVKFSRAYALYRLGNLNEALEITKGLKLDNESAVLELKGQVFYKQGNFAAAKSAFEQLTRSSENEKTEVKVNLLAAMAASNEANRLEEFCQKYKITLEDGFETVFNEACNFIELEDYETAQELIELALREGQETLLEEEWTQEEVDLELLPLTLQLLFLKTISGNAESPIKVLTEALNQTGISPSIKNVIENNLIAAKSLKFPEQPPKRMLYEYAKKLEKMTSSSSVALLSPSQSITVRCNQTLLLIALNHIEDSTTVMEALQYEEPDSKKVKLTKAVLLSKQKKNSEAIKLLENVMKHHEGGIALGPLLFKAQLLCAEGSHKAALKLLLEIEDDSIKYKGSMVATKIALMEHAADYNGCCTLLDEVLAWWRQQELTNKATMAIAWLLEKYSTIKIKRGDLIQALHFCKESLEVESDNLKKMMLISRFSRLLTLTSNEDDEILSQQLPSGLSVNAEDVDALEGNINGTKRGEASLRKIYVTEGTTKKRKKRPRYPKGFDPDNPGPKPDPERWLPKWQRSGHRKRSHNRKNDPAKGSQGAGKVDESLDRRLNPSEASTSKPSRPSGRTGSRSKGSRR